MLSSAVLTLLSSYLLPTSYAWNNGLSKVPALGYNNWNAFHCDINETVVRKTATLMKSLGLQDAGYNYVNIDDCWLKKVRDVKGELSYDDTKFPSKSYSYSCAHVINGGYTRWSPKYNEFSTSAWIQGGNIYQGLLTCAGFAGSLGYELTDAFSFLEWGFDYIKIDNCNSDSFNGTNPERFQRWTDALKVMNNQVEGGAMFVYSLVEWQSFDAWTWAPAIANSWRIYDDIQPNWGRITEILNNASFIGNFSGHFAHNDLDMLEIGNGDLTLAEQRSHFTAWALNKSPMLIGTDLTKLSKDSLDILKNKEILAINQDEYIGAPLTPFFWGKNPDGTWDPSFPAQYWSGHYGPQNQTAIMYINFNNRTVDLNFTFSQSPHLKADSTYAVRDLWAHEEKGNFSKFFFGPSVGTHDVRAYMFTEVH